MSPSRAQPGTMEDPDQSPKFDGDRRVNGVIAAAMDVPPNSFMPKHGACPLRWAAGTALHQRPYRVLLTAGGWVHMRAGLNLKMNHEFSLAELPVDLAAVLRDYDVDNSGSVSVAELVAGAQLMRQQAKKVRSWQACLHSGQQGLTRPACTRRTS